MQGVEKFESLDRSLTAHLEEQVQNISLQGCTYHEVILTFVQGEGIPNVLLYHSYVLQH